MLKIDVQTHTARTIYALLRHELNIDHSPKAEQVALHLAEYLDRKPQEMFGMTYQELHDAVIESKMRKLNTRPFADWSELT